MRPNKRSKRWHKKKKREKSLSLKKALKFKNRPFIKKAKLHIAIGFGTVSFLLSMLLIFAHLNTPVTTSQYIKGKVLGREPHFKMRGSKVDFKTTVELINGDIVRINYFGQKKGDEIEFEIFESAITHARIYKER